MNAQDRLLEKLGTERSTADSNEDFDQVEIQEEWVGSLRLLYDQMMEWLSTAIGEGLIVASKDSYEIDELDLGQYDVPTLIFSTPRNHRIHIIPQERFVIGYMGRVLIRSGSQKMWLYRNQADEWLIGSRQFSGLQTSALNQESFLDLIVELLP